MRACLLICIATLGCGGVSMDMPDASAPADGGIDAGATDAGATDSGVPDAGTDGGVTDAGQLDAGAPDSGTADAGIDAGAGDAGGPRPPGPGPRIEADASIAMEDAGYTAVDLLGRTTLATTPASTIDSGFVVAISATSLVVAEGSRCQLSFINRYACDYRWLSPSGATLATVTNASGLPHVRGEVMMLFRDHQSDCPDPVIANTSLTSAIPSLMDVESGAIRLTWARAESSALRDVLEKGDLVPSPGGGRSCDAGTPVVVPGPTTFNRVRPPYEQLTGARAAELGAAALLLIDGNGAVARISADAGRVTLVPPGVPAYAEVQRDTFTLALDRGHYRGGIDGGALRPLVTLSGSAHLRAEGGRFAAVVTPPASDSRLVVDSEGLMPDLTYPVAGQLLERAPLLYGRDPTGKLFVARLELGSAAVSPFNAQVGVFDSGRFPDDDAVLIIDSQQVAWMLETSGLKRLANRAVHVPLRRFIPAPAAPNVVLVVRRPVPSGPFELLAVDRRTRRIVTLSQQAFVDTSPTYLGGCDVPGLLTPGAEFFYFAETSSVPGQLNLFLVGSALTDVPRLVGTTSQADCRVPVVSRDGTRVAVSETQGGVTVVKTASW